MIERTALLAGADGAFDIVWDELGVAHVYATTVADAYRGMGYAAASERLWQIHLSCAYANGQAAALLGERFVAQDALQRACNVHGGHGERPASDGDWIASAYLDGMNAFVEQLDEVPAEFHHAGTTPRRFTLDDIAARYRFTSWFQHKSWTEKMLLGRLMATHGTDYFRHHVLHFSDADAALITMLREPLRTLPTAALPLAYPDFSGAAISGSNNWAITGALSASGKPMLATDPHQPHGIPNTFFYVHLHVDEWDAFGAAFPGVPYFMMGYTREIAWGLTTGFVDCYDVYIEQLRNRQYRTPDGWQPISERTERIAIKGGTEQTIVTQHTRHGLLLESLTDQLGLTEPDERQYATALHWSLTTLQTSAGALAQLPLARSAEEFGNRLFENDVCPLVNNIICVDRQDHLRRFIATTLPARRSVTGSVPLAGWDAAYDFPRSRAADLVVEIDPPHGFSLTANEDTMGHDGPFYIHNFPTHSARADRIRELLLGNPPFSVRDFQAGQLDLLDLRAQQLLPDLIAMLQQSKDEQVQRAADLLASWDCVASADAAPPCLFYPFTDRAWYRRFMRKILNDKLINAIPGAAPGLNRFDISDFLHPGSPWLAYQREMAASIAELMQQVITDVETSLGKDWRTWRWGDLHQVQFNHRLAQLPPWQDLSVGPDPIGGSPTTLAMAMHMGPGPGARSADAGAIACRVFHGPAFRLVVDLGDPDHAQFVIAGGNGGAGSAHATDHYQSWLQGRYYRLSLLRAELEPTATVRVTP